MTNLFPSLVFFLITGLVLAEVVAGPGRKAVYRHLQTLRIWVCLCGLLLVAFAMGRPPLYGTFEGGVTIAFCMGILSRLFGKSRDLPGHFFRINSLVLLAVLLLQGVRSIELNSNYYMYDSLLVVLFFNLRLVATAFLAHAASQFLATLKARHADILFQGGRNSLLAGTCLFLVSEWCGSLWALNWLGDAWLWNRGFFKAAILFLLVMTACHLPGPIFKQRACRAFLGALPGTFAVWMTFYY